MIATLKGFMIVGTTLGAPVLADITFGNEVPEELKTVLFIAFVIGVATWWLRGTFDGMRVDIRNLQTEQKGMRKDFDHLKKALGA